MLEYRFAVIISTAVPSTEDILKVADCLGDAGCTDASIRGHAE
ncbi:MAG: hypothetical protein ACREJM_09915 [Candidatus Saccharimonadales bacterium]